MLRNYTHSFIFSTADGEDAEYYKAIARYKADGQDQVEH
jgi:hypothetical protein